MQRYRQLHAVIKYSLIYSNLWVALALTYITLAIGLQVTGINITIIVLNFLTAFAGYNYLYLSVFYLKPNKIVSNRATWLQQHKVLLSALTLLSAAACGYIVMQAPQSIQIRYFAFALFSFGYCLPTKRNIGLRWIPSFKIILISTTWTILVTLGFPSPLTSNLTAFAAIWLFVFGLTIPFDIRDIKTDPVTLKTIPQLIGVKASIILSQCCIALSMALITYTHYSPITAISNFVFAVTSTLLIRKVKFNDSDSYINFCIEGLPIIWLITTWLINLL
jgi:hypothetical protein